MPIHIDPVTRQRVVYSKRCGDLQYNLTGDSAISKETVPVVGDWEDNIPGNNGSAVVNSQNQQMFAGTDNQLQGTDANIEAGAKLPGLNVVGQTKQTTRRRTIRRHIDL